jgi:hypothetical protein
MPYNITKYTYDQAKKIGVEIKHSTNKTKKIDVYRKGKKVCSVGAYGMNDFPTYVQLKGQKYANSRRRLYKIRHTRDRKTKWSCGWFADKLLW